MLIKNIKPKHNKIFLPCIRNSVALQMPTRQLVDAFHHRYMEEEKKKNQLKMAQFQ